jgi:hypothetical protein
MDPKGIESLKALLKFLITAGEAVDVSAADDKWSLGDYKNFLSVIPTVGPAIKHVSEVGDELKDLDDDEKRELADFIKAELELVDKELEHSVEKYIDIAVEAADTIQKVFATLAKKKGE